MVATLALHTALFQPNSLILLLAKAQRQAYELFRKVLGAYNALGRPLASVQDAQSLSKLELANGSRIIGLPGKEENVRYFAVENADSRLRWQRWSLRSEATAQGSG